jgi:hypothetical protein
VTDRDGHGQRRGPLLGAWTLIAAATCGFSIGGTLAAALSGDGRPTLIHAGVTLAGGVVAAVALYDVLRIRDGVATLGERRFWDEVRSAVASSWRTHAAVLAAGVGVGAIIEVAASALSI